MGKKRTIEEMQSALERAQREREEVEAQMKRLEVMRDRIKEEEGMWKCVIAQAELAEKHEKLFADLRGWVEGMRTELHERTTFKMKWPQFSNVPYPEALLHDVAAALQQFDVPPELTEDVFDEATRFTVERTLSSEEIRERIRYETILYILLTAEDPGPFFERLRELPHDDFPLKEIFDYDEKRLRTVADNHEYEFWEEEEF